MKVAFQSGLVAMAASCSVAMTAAGAEAKTCYHAGGSATMITKSLAEFMAEAALKNSIAAHGWTAAGPIKMVCKDDMMTTSCTARRLACK